MPRRFSEAFAMARLITSAAMAELIKVKDIKIAAV